MSDRVQGEKMKKFGIFFISLILFAFLGTFFAFAVVKAGSPCAKLNQVSTISGYKYTCIKSGNKLIWSKGTKISIPTPASTNLARLSPIAVMDLSATISTNEVNFSFTKPDLNPEDAKYELGYQILAQDGQDPSFSLNYLQPVKYRELSATYFSLELSEVRRIFTEINIDGSNRAIMFKIRTLIDSNYSSWGNGIYLTPSQYQEKPSTITAKPTPSPTPSSSASPNPFQSAAERAAADKAAADKAAANQVKYCDLKNGCKVGEIGPGGGFVFYVASSPQSWGTYLEVADTNIQSQWCNSTKTYLSKNVTDEKLKLLIGDEIGKGQGNTLMMLAGCQSGAANTATNYRGGGLSDWFLPSLMELNEVCKFARVQPTGTSAICSPTGPLLNLFSTSFYKSPVIGQYWSSSEYTSTGADGWTAWTVSFFANQWHSSENKQGLRPVIAIRAFGPKI